MRQISAVFPKANQRLHCLLAASRRIPILFQDGLTHELGNRCALLPGANVQGFPDIFVQIEFCPLHDVHYTSCPKDSAKFM